MLFNKPLIQVEYSDIEKLKDDEIDESLILDYKEQMINENKLIKQINAFSNTMGGLLIFGIKESGQGGHPDEINGIEPQNAERLEHIISSNIIPKISVQFHKINKPDSDKIILIIRIPEGQNQPYYDNHSKKYYKRYNFKAEPMGEHEIEALYQKRFFGVGKLSKYITDAILFNRDRLRERLRETSTKIIDGHIIITPLRIDNRIFDSSNMREIDFNTNDIRLDPRPRDLYLEGISKPSRYGIQWSNQFDTDIEVHRNGLIHYMRNYGNFNKENVKTNIWDYMLASNLLQTIQFADIIYSKFNFTGKVKVILQVMNSFDSEIVRGSFSQNKSNSEEIYIEREWDSWKLRDDYLKIGKNMIDEFSNYFRLWNSDLFHESEETLEFRGRD